MQVMTSEQLREYAKHFLQSICINNEITNTTLTTTSINEENNISNHSPWDLLQNVMCSDQ